MTFERPDAWWLLALAAPIVALHLHHRRRVLVEVSSIELWRGLVPGSAGRGRFRLLRDALALAFLVAALAAFTASAAGPVTGTAASEARRLAIVVDASATMSARATRGTTRYDTAFAWAGDAQARLAPQDDVTVWLSAGTHRVVVGPTKRRDRLVDAFLTHASSFPATLTPSRLAETTRLAASAAAGVDGRSAAVLVLTDRVGASALSDLDFDDADVRVAFVDDDRPSTNSGIVACDLDPADATKVVVRVATIDGPPTPRELVLSAGEKELRRTPLTFDSDGAATVALPLGDAAKTGGLVGVSLDPPDDFAPDDVARLMLPAARPLAVAVVAERPSPFLVEALRAMPEVADPARTTLVAPGGDVGDADVVIAEGVAAPAGKPTLTFVGSGPRVAEKPLLWGVGTHALLDGVDLSPLRIERAVVLDVAAGEAPIVASAAGTVGVVGGTDGVRRVTFGFRPDATTLPLEAAFPLLVRNALRWLAKPPAPPRYVVAGEPWPDGDGALVPYPQPGGPDVVRSPAGVETVVRWIPPKGFRLSPKSPTKFSSAADVVASLSDRSRDADTRRRHAPWLAAVGAALLGLGAALLPRTRRATSSNPPPTSAPPVEAFAASR